MNTNKGLFSKIVGFLRYRPSASDNDQGYGSRDNGDYNSNSGNMSVDFDGDYRSATAMLRERMSERFPDNFYARVGSEMNSARDYGDERASAVDTASAAIAAALRKGATVKQAAEAGAASVGI
ncbi:hypothetical protein FV242_24625 [Methylobacterium sp. WL64]|uniref:hypothetical protein n=1 Tax=Methylobacterium sp. WL64 TaxID=2603894 RepID=UPI0011CA0F92|nr:hypothetical protein [Methylobacterium sp. WL64]TXM99693.1 hypothetical protein FV242_24625 [Methylobacterium sp. WL64]